MEKFASLPAEKQTQIIDGALQAFSINGYKKTSVSDIAAAAGISKAMVFHYFGTKKALYLYLIKFCSQIVMNAITEKFDKDVTDFFERIQMVSMIKILAMQKHPAILSFLSSILFEKDEEVRQDIQFILAMGEGFRNQIAFDGLDISKFKDGVDPKLVMKILVRYSEGFVSELPSDEVIDPEALYREFDECTRLLRTNLYKEEYL
ncbi:TetR/AcrR family transcriptional regulator ['Paenibacillus yunnanensis' Narsing Rao et al. 2020]|uniref:TetR/AcrR family transcriptional regulator n=1 Tax=Paenibacillus tengchongensis TaxID=2608684 RepID=UPI00124CE720|nr:TetR/AcrR family transcriptional regulator [Paenibacillus tengchongensis]